MIKKKDQSALATLAKLSPGFLSNVLAGLYSCSFDTATALAKITGSKRSIWREEGTSTQRRNAFERWQGKELLEPLTDELVKAYKTKPLQEKDKTRIGPEPTEKMILIKRWHRVYINRDGEAYISYNGRKWRVDNEDKRIMEN